MKMKWSILLDLMLFNPHWRNEIIGQNLGETYLRISSTATISCQRLRPRLWPRHRCSSLPLRCTVEHVLRSGSLLWQCVPPQYAHRLTHYHRDALFLCLFHKDLLRLDLGDYLPFLFLVNRCLLQHWHGLLSLGVSEEHTRLTFSNNFVNLFDIHHCGRLLIDFDIVLPYNWCVAVYLIV